MTLEIFGSSASQTAANFFVMGTCTHAELLMSLSLLKIRQESHGIYKRKPCIIHKERGKRSSWTVITPFLPLVHFNCHPLSKNPANCFSFLILIAEW